MIGLDTNVLLRYLVRDDREQFARARHVIEEGLTPQNPAWVSLIVTAELIWTLRSFYGYGRAEVADVVERLFDTSEVVFEAEAVVEQALALFRNSGIDFADALIMLSNQVNGCRATLSFDRKLVQAGLAAAP